MFHVILSKVKLIDKKYLMCIEILPDHFFTESYNMKSIYYPCQLVMCSFLYGSFHNVSFESLTVLMHLILFVKVSSNIMTLLTHEILNKEDVIILSL